MTSRASKPSGWSSAKTYVDQQLENMKRHGAAPTLSQEQYEDLITRVVVATRQATEPASRNRRAGR